MTSQQITTFVVLTTGLLLLFYFTGILTSADTITGSMINATTNPEGFKASDLYTDVWGFITAGILVGVIIVGYFTKNIELAIMSSVVGVLGVVLFDIIKVFQKVAGVHMAIALLIFSPLVALLLFALVDWWRGRG